jgi:peptidoglycan/LPS O-acetylase OafA/YrhL
VGRHDLLDRKEILEVFASSSTAITLCLAVLLWRLVEAPGRRLKRYTIRSRCAPTLDERGARIDHNLKLPI